MIKIVIIDDHQLFADGLAALLQSIPHFELVGTFNQIQEITKELVILSPNVILLDVGFQGEDSVEFCHHIKTQMPDVKVLVVSMHTEFFFVLGMKKAGASGYITKNADRNEIINAIEEVNNGNEWYKGVIKNALNHKNAYQEDPIQSLSYREYQILKLIMQNRNTREIAEQIGLSIKTIEHYRNSLYIKMGVKNLSELLNKMHTMKHHL